MTTTAPATPDSLSKAQLIDALLAIFGTKGMLYKPDDMLVYEFDASIDNHLPEAVVFPSNTEQVAALMRLADRYDVPVTPRGAGTGLSGGTIAARGGIVVAMARMKRIIEIDIANRCAVVEPGVVNLDLSVAAAPYGYFYAPDPASQKASTIGGNVALNAGGPHCLAYGVTTNHVLGVEVVVPGGEIIMLGGKEPDRPGYDLTGFVVGSEGTLGIVTKVIVRLTHQPEGVRTFLASFRTIDDASATVSDIIGHGIIPAALEMMDQVMVQAIEAAFHAGYPEGAGAVLLIEVDGLRESLDDVSDPIMDICRVHGCLTIAAAADEAERARLWAGRKGAAGAFGRIAPNFYLHDAVVPRSKLPRVLHDIMEVGKKHDLIIANVFHAGDGNLHPNISFDMRVPGELEKVIAAGEEILRICIDAGGVLSGEHGIGTEKQEYMAWLYSKDDMNLQRRVKEAFNPRDLVNPWKVFPTRANCGEMGLKERVIRGLPTGIPGLEDAWV